jgi:hypothetical protein
MSEEQDTSAFPLHLHGDYGKGVTLRDYFAAAALQGLLQVSALPVFDDDGNNTGMIPDGAHLGLMNGPGNTRKGIDSPSNSMAWAAYGYADAMLEARKEDA